MIETNTEIDILNKQVEQNIKTPSLERRQIQLQMEKEQIEMDKEKDKWKSCCGREINQHFLKYVIQVSFGASLVLFSMAPNRARCGAEGNLLFADFIYCWRVYASTNNERWLSEIKNHLQYIYGYRMYYLIQQRDKSMKILAHCEKLQHKQVILQNELTKIQ